MMTHAYNPIYVNKAARVIGHMLHDAVYGFQYEGAQFLQMFIQSGIAAEIEDGSPKYIAGKSGMELFCDVVEATSGKEIQSETIESYERSNAYWVGHILAYYQWYSKRSFRDILEVIPYEELLGLYDTLHEADVQKSYEVFDAHFADAPTKLQAMRKRIGFTQEELASASGVPVSTIRAYERRAKDLNKAQVDIVIRLADALECEITDVVW